MGSNQNNLGNAYGTCRRGPVCAARDRGYEPVTCTPRRRAPSVGKAQNNLGNAYQNSDATGAEPRRAMKYKAALRVYTEEADPEGHARLCNNLAWVLAHDMEPSRPSEALPLAEKAVSLAPESATLDTLAHCYYRLERWSEALEAWDRALALDPSYVDDYNAYEGLELREMVEEARRRASEA